MLTPMLAQILIMVSVTYLWLYLNGNEYTVITGGWMAQAWAGASGWTARLPGLSKGESSMGVVLTDPTPDVSTYSGVVRVTNAIDLSAVSRIRVTLSASLSGPIQGQNGGQTIYLMATAATSGDWPWSGPSAAGVLANVHNHTSYGTQQIPPSEILSDVQYELDVSGLPDGSYYACVGFLWYKQYTFSSITIKSVEMLAA